MFITGDASADDAKSRAKLTLSKAEPFTIPPGQFALILTEECVEIPADALAFISMKTTHKLKGLVNVSGFHVDPGWNGYLTFGVYNAGPAHVHLHRGQDMFLIWFASLDRPNEPDRLYRGDKNEKPILPPKYLAAMSGDVFSPMRLKDDMVTLEKDISRIDSWLQLFRYITIPLLVAALLAVTPIFFRVIWDQWAPIVTPILRSIGLVDPLPTGSTNSAATTPATAAPATGVAGVGTALTPGVDAQPATASVEPPAPPDTAPSLDGAAQGVQPPADNESSPANQ